jgi:hypothetical protein
VPEFVDGLRDLNVTPHIAQNTSNRTSAIDARMTRHPVMRSANRIASEPFGWGGTTLAPISRDIDNRPKSGDLQVSAPYNFNIQPAMARPISSGESS